MIPLEVDIERVFPGKLQKIPSSFGLGLDRQRPYSAARRNDVVAGQGLVQLETLVDVTQDKIDVLIRDMNDRIVDPGIGGADASSGAHGDYEEEPAVVREESQHAVIGGEPLHDQVYALGKRMMMLGPLSGQLVVLVDVRARRR